MVKRILVGVDFSEASKTALAQAHEWANRLGVPMVAIHILQPPAPMLPEAQMALPDPAWLDTIEIHALEQLRLCIQDYPGASALVKWGSPAEEIVAEADLDTLIVVAHVGHSAFERILFGSTAIKVVKHAPCDVLVVRAPNS
ncbi:universal stress protein [Holophaga foetida]|uniref:universal stress protein n=1 Tax=Holophaga foetida TaxID=35839 RepID=UPI00024749A9|nr:universal stress protein [Holophaga foetida]